jgi:hypothetical protein
MKTKIFIGLKNVLLPRKATIFIFIVLLLIISFLFPLYPVNVSYTRGRSENGIGTAEYSRNYTEYLPLAVVVIGDYTWTLTDAKPLYDSSGYFPKTLPHSFEIWDCSANPIFTILFIPLFILVYIASGFLALYLKHKLVKGVKDMGG